MNRELSTMSANSAITQISTTVLKERTTKVRFAGWDKVDIFQPVDPELKSTLYYSREEIFLIQRRFQMAKVLRQAQKRANELKQALKENKVFVNYLSEEKGTTKAFPETPEVSTKRRRLNLLDSTVV